MVVTRLSAEREQPSDFVFGLASTNIVEYVALEVWRIDGGVLA